VIAHLWTERPSENFLDKPSKAAAIPKSLSESKATRVGFLSHIINLETLRRMDASLEGVSESDFRRLFRLNLNHTAPFCYHQQEIRGLKGESIILNVYGLFIPSYQFEEDLRQQTHLTFKKVQNAVDLATSEGCHYFGLGQYTSIVSMNGQLLKNRIPITTGNSLTAGMAVRGIEDLMKKRGISVENVRIGVVGFTGNICQVVAQLLGDFGAPMTLIHREPFAESPRFQAAVKTLFQHSTVSKDTLICTHDINALKDCDVVLVGTNSAQQFILPEHLKPNAIVLDISVPSNLHPSVKSSNQFTCFQGGFARFPFEQVPGHHWIPAAGTKNWFACMAETILCGLYGIKESYSIGTLNKNSIIETLRMADEMGVTLGDLRREL
jgi:predicted amino acid dehydrogenase